MGRDDRSCLQRYPRHIASLRIGKLSSPTSKLSPLLLTDDFLKIMTSHFAAFSFKKFSSVNYFTVVTCASSDDRLEASVRMSSACKKAPAYMLLTVAPMESDWSCLKRGSMTSKNSAGDRVEPCHTPRPRANEGDACCPTRTELRQSVY